MDFNRGGSSPLARLPLSQGADSDQTLSSYSVWMVGVGVPTQLARITLDHDLEYGEPLSCLCFLLHG